MRLHFLNLHRRGCLWYFLLLVHTKLLFLVFFFFSPLRARDTLTLSKLFLYLFLFVCFLGAFFVVVFFLQCYYSRYLRFKLWGKKNQNRIVYFSQSMELCLIIHNIYRNPAESISQNVNQNQNPTFIFRMDSDNKVIVKSFYNRNTKSVNAIV